MSANVDRYGRARTPQNIAPRMPVYHVPTHSTVYDNRSHSSGWKRFNNFFVNIGEWFQNGYDDFELFLFEKVSPILLLVLGIGTIAGGIVTWIRDGFWSFVLYFFIAMVIVGISSKYLDIILGIPIVIFRLIFFVLRLIFTNAITFFLTLGVAVGVIVYASNSSPTLTHKTQTDQITSTQVTTPYVCEASTLNVRLYASPYAAVIGHVRRGDKLEVYKINNGFAEIKYKGKIGYVSCRYINQY